MKNTRFLRCAALALLMLTLAGCAGGGSAAATGATGAGGPPRGDPLFEASHWDLDIKGMAQERLWATLIGLSATAAFLATLITLLGDMRSFWKWLAIMMAILLWFVVTDAIVTGIEGAWPEEFTQVLVDDTLGRTEGLISEGDKSPWGKPLADITLIIIPAALAVIHLLSGVWVLVMGVLLLLNNIGSGSKLVFPMAGAGGGLVLARAIVPQVLYEVTLRIGAKRAVAANLPVVGDVPVVGEAAAAAINTFNQLSLCFAVEWWLGFGLLFALFILGFGAVAAKVAPIVGGWLVGGGKLLYRNHQYRQREARREQAWAEREEARAAREAERRGEPMDPDEYERRLREAEGAEPLPAGFEERGGLVLPRELSHHSARRRDAVDSDRPTPRFYVCPACLNSFWATTAPGESVNCQRCGEKILYDESYEDEAERERVADATDESGSKLNWGRTRDNAGKVLGLAALAYAPEIVIPLVALNHGVKAVRSSPNQDPDMAVRQLEAENALTDFAADDEEAS